MRSGWATAEITASLVAAHTAAGGALPSLPWVTAMAGVVFVAGLAVLKGRVSPRVAVPALVVVQLVLHCYLNLLTAPHATHAMAHVHEQHAAVGHLLTVPMLIAHLVGAAVTALSWEFRARAVDVLVAWSRPRAQLVPQTRLPVTETLPWVRPATQLVIAIAPRRGPPVPVRHA